MPGLATDDGTEINAGACLLNSEYIFKRGTGPMAGLKCRRPENKTARYFLFGSNAAGNETSFACHVIFTKSLGIFMLQLKQFLCATSRV